MIKDFALTTSALQKLAVSTIYIINILAILLLFITPAYIWYYLYKNKQIKPKNLVWIFFGSITIFFISPVFHMKRMNSQFLIGTDILTNQIPFINNILLIILAGIIVATIFFVLHRRYPKNTARVGFFVSLIYFAFYLFHFFIDIWYYYINAITIMLQNHQYLIGFHLFIFFIITILFYIGGYILLVYEVYAKQKL